MPKSKKNPNIHAAISKPKQMVSSKEDVPPAQKEREPWSHETHLGVKFEVTRSIVYYRNKKFPNAEQHFPWHPLMRTVDFFFPFAEGGALYIDEPKNLADFETCKKKAPFLMKEGCRYLIRTEGMEEDEAREAIQEPDRKVG